MVECPSPFFSKSFPLDNFLLIFFFTHFLYLYPIIHPIFTFYIQNESISLFKPLFFLFEHFSQLFFYSIEKKPVKQLSKKEQKAKEDAEFEALMAGIPADQA